MRYDSDNYICCSYTGNNLIAHFSKKTTATQNEVYGKKDLKLYKRNTRLLR